MLHHDFSILHSCQMLPSPHFLPGRWCDGFCGTISFRGSVQPSCIRSLRPRTPTLCPALLAQLGSGVAAGQLCHCSLVWELRLVAELLSLGLCHCLSLLQGLCYVSLRLPLCRRAPADNGCAGMWVWASCFCPFRD